MSFREMINNNPMIAVGAMGIAAIVLIVVLVFFGTGNGHRDVVDVYYYDIDNQELFVAGSDVEDPGAGRGEVARAAVYGCGGCDPDDIFVGYLRDGDRVREPDRGEWVPRQSERGLEITEAPIRKCREQGQPARHCEPR